MSPEMLTYSKYEDELYQECFSKVYQHTQGYQQYALSEKQQFAREAICPTYGELLYPSVKKILQRFPTDSRQSFLDLGSGLGKCALQIFMQTDCQKVIGIEASLALHTQANAVLHEMQSTFPFYWEGRELIFVQGNFLQEDWQGATVVYTCSTCFSETLLEAIGERINQELSVAEVFSLRPLPSLTRLPLHAVFSVECSWDSALCFHYKNQKRGKNV